MLQQLTRISIACRENRALLYDGWWCRGSLLMALLAQLR